MSTLDEITQDHRSVVDRAREVVHGVWLNPDEHRVLVRAIAKAISDAEIRGIQNCRASGGTT